jgi:hypothetical protein
MCRLSMGQDTVSQAHGSTGLRPSYSLRWFNFAKYSRKGGEISVFNTMTSATTFNPNNYEQLFKASGLVEANIATTVTKDNICASGKEGIKGNDQRDNRTSLCKPEDLFLAFAHIENKLARAWLHKFDERKKILIDPSATLSEHHVSDTKS